MHLDLGLRHHSEPQPSARDPSLWSASPGLFPEKKVLVRSSLSEWNLPTCSAAQPAPGGRLCHQTSCDSGSGVQSSLYGAVTVPKPWFHWQFILLLIWPGIGAWGGVIILVGCIPARRKSLRCTLCPTSYSYLSVPIRGPHLLSPRKESSGRI